MKLRQEKTKKGGKQIITSEVKSIVRQFTIFKMNLN